MTPRPALFLGLAGLLPFLWGALTVLFPALGAPLADVVGARFVGVPVLIGYGTVILCFMAGVLWGFATRAEAGLQWRAHAVSVLPALWAFLAVGGTPAASLSALLVGFLGLFPLDLQFGKWQLVPRWWIGLRAGLTLVVLICLGVGFAFGR